MKTLRKLFICLVLSLVVGAAVTPAFAQNAGGSPKPAATPGFSFKWWQNERFQKELKLTSEQITRIEGIFQAAEPMLRAQKDAVDRREEKLSKLISDPKSTESGVLQATDRLEMSRNELTRTRTLMLFRIRRVLSDEQLLALNVMHEHDRSERDRKERERKDKGQN
jgi:Spy/CpxP family protein refolding chaperone